MEKRDFKKELKHLYNPSAKEVSFADVPPMTFLMLDGQGDPNNSPVFQAAVETLFTLSYTLKFMIKKGETAIDYGVMPLEGLWWHDDMEKFSVEDKSSWKWTLMIMQPELISAEMVEEARKVAEKKKPARLDEVRFESFHEGTAAQIMHIGPFSEEKPAVDKIHKYIEDQGKTKRGKHHEIYLSDIRKANPANWKTVIRQGME
ncbi:MAG: GyrI-like domain-containing protein [Firmicutes bacterium]|nr:GyrI-like domain-containing protein [Bacillota bacterium]